MDTLTLKKAKIFAPIKPQDNGIPIRNGLIVDVETTGLDKATSKVIEICLLPFKYQGSEIIEASQPITFFQDPCEPIPPEITQITGIDDDMVRGKQIDQAVLDAAFEAADIVIAHNAAFDRPFVERLTEVAATKAWACSMSEIDWRAQGYNSRSLELLLFKRCHMFYDAHRAENDCIAVLNLLAQPENMQELLVTARKPSYRICAVHAAFETKDVLKARGYRWNDGRNGGFKSWYIDVLQAQKEDELLYLRNEIYRDSMHMAVCQEFNAFTRYKGE